MKKSGSKQGFTLAEVLVTLAIIGVVAALTIPTLIQSANAQKYSAALKKAISTLNSALQMEIANDSVDASSITDSATLTTFMAKNLNVLKTNAAGDTIWLADGSKIQFHGLAAGCVDISTPSAFAVASNCYAIVDVNGDKGPNTVATATSLTDVYVIGIGKSAVIPVTTDATAATASTEDIAGATQVNAVSIASNDASFKIITNN